MGRRDWYYVNLPKLLIKRLDSFMETPRAKSMGMTNRPQLLRKVINDFLEEQEKLYNNLESIKSLSWRLRNTTILSLHLMIKRNFRKL